MLYKNTYWAQFPGLFFLDLHFFLLTALPFCFELLACILPCRNKRILTDWLIDKAISSPSAHLPTTSIAIQFRSGYVSASGRPTEDTDIIRSAESINTFKRLLKSFFIFSLIPWPFILSYSMLYLLLVLICVTRPCNVPRHVTARYKSSFHYCYYYFLAHQHKACRQLKLSIIIIIIIYYYRVQTFWVTGRVCRATPQHQQPRHVTDFHPFIT